MHFPFLLGRDKKKYLFSIPSFFFYFNFFISWRPITICSFISIKKGLLFLARLQWSTRNSIETAQSKGQRPLAYSVQTKGMVHCAFRAFQKEAKHLQQADFYELLTWFFMFLPSFPLLFLSIFKQLNHSQLITTREGLVIVESRS